MPHQSLFLRKLKENFAEVEKQEERQFLLSDNWAHSEEQDFNFCAFIEGEQFSPINREGMETDAFKFDSSTVGKRVAGHIAEQSVGPNTVSNNTVNRNSEKLPSSQEEQKQLLSKGLVRNNFTFTNSRPDNSNSCLKR